MKWEPRASFEGSGKIIFQCLDWYCEDVQEDQYLTYKVYVFGITDTGIPVNVRLDSFYPFFFIELPKHWDNSYKYSIRDEFKNVQDVSILNGKKYYGFENNKVRNFAKLSFYSSKAMNSVRYRIENREFKTVMFKNLKDPIELYESNIDPVLRLTHIRDILTAGWVELSEYVMEEELVVASWKSIKPYDNSNKMSDIRVMYFDIEACSEDGSFPDPTKPKDRVTQICCIYKDSVSKNTCKFLFNLGTCGEIEDTRVFEYSKEANLLKDFASFIRETNPDIIVGYNIFGFDNGYLFERSKVLEIDTFNFQSKMSNYRTEIKKKVLNNQQSGFNEWKMTRIVGRIHIDLLQVIKKDFKLESYKLDYVGEHFLKQGKDDVTPMEIFEAWSKEHGTKEKRNRVGKYCVQDTNLCLLLFEKFAVLPNHIEMAKVTRVPIEYLVTRGQSIKVFSQIAYETRKAGYFIPVLPRNYKESKFQGATVLEAKVGFYQKPVAGLDFASLYPSIMIAHNMCYCTVVLDPIYENLPGVEYSTIEWDTDDFETGKKHLKFTFVQNQEGVLSGILQNLWKARKVTKKEMNIEKDPFTKTVLNAKQLAIKVSMNSIYGFTGAVVGALPCLAISQSVTGCGRQMIEQTSSIAKNQFNCEIVYGDSVTGDTPVLISQFGKICIETIEALFKSYTSTDFPQFKSDQSGLSNKEQSIPRDTVQLKAWTSKGWSPIKRIIRHLCKKEIFRVFTPTGVVDVTSDHSLLDINLNELKPGKLEVGQELYHDYPDKVVPANLSIPLVYKKLFLEEMVKSGDSSLFSIDLGNSKLTAAYLYLVGSIAQYYISIDYDESGIILFFSKNQMKSYNKVTKIISLGFTYEYVYDLETDTGNFQAGIGQMIVKNTDSCYVIFPEPPDSDGTLTTLFKKAEYAAAEISKTFRKPIELEFEKFMYPLILVAKKRYMYVEWTDAKQHNGEIEAKGVELVRRDNCPYVKETLDAVLHPIMFKNNIQLGKEEAEKHIDMLLNGEVPIKKLILSKTLKNEYKGYIKKYEYTEDITGNKIKTPNYTWYREKEISFGKRELIQECPKMAHVALVDKMRARDPNSAPKPGDRVPFVYVDIADPKALSWKKTEDPLYVIENKIPIDSLYYLEHQLKNPLKTIFDILLGVEKCEKLFDRKSLQDAKAREKATIADAKRIKDKNHDIRTFFSIKLK